MNPIVRSGGGRGRCQIRPDPCDQQGSFSEMPRWVLTIPGKAYDSEVMAAGYTNPLADLGFKRASRRRRDDTLAIPLERSSVLSVGIRRTASVAAVDVGRMN